MTGLAKEHQTLTIQMFEDYREQPVDITILCYCCITLMADPLHHLLEIDVYHEQAARCSSVRITLLSRPSVRDNRVEIYEASLRFVADLTGIKYFAYYWFFTSATIWISFILAIQLVGAAISTDTHIPLLLLSIHLSLLIIG
jgi:hypothetical protein